MLYLGQRLPKEVKLDFIIDPYENRLNVKANLCLLMNRSNRSEVDHFHPGG